MNNWKKVRYIKTSDAGPFSEHTWEFEIELPEPLASWDVFDYWEKERVYSMSTHLDRSDVLFDVGAEHGWMSVVFARFCDVFLIEPTKEFWPNIKETWIRNWNVAPIGTFQGLVGNKTDFDQEINFKQWPDAAGGNLIDKNKYQYLHEHESDMKTITIDDLVKRSGVTPTALTIDVEGAELLVLQGAEKTLQIPGMKVWVSEHDDLALRDYGVKPGKIERFMSKLGYRGDVLATDHERHVYYHKFPGFPAGPESNFNV